MTQTKNLETPAINRSPLMKHMIIGAGIALAVILTFVIGADNTPSEWGKYWMARPLIITPLSGAAGGFCFYFLAYFFGRRGGWEKVLATVIGVIVYIVGLWLGIVLGLDGTMWN